MADVAMAESMEHELANDAVFWGEVENMDNSSHEEWLLAITGSLMRRERRWWPGWSSNAESELSDSWQERRGGGRRQQ